MKGTSFNQINCYKECRMSRMSFINVDLSISSLAVSSMWIKFSVYTEKNWEWAYKRWSRPSSFHIAENKCCLCTLYVIILTQGAWYDLTATDSTCLLFPAAALQLSTETIPTVGSCIS